MAADFSGGSAWAIPTRLGDSNGAGHRDLLDKLDGFPAPHDELEGESPIQLAIIGARIGQSSLLNAICGEPRRSSRPIRGHHPATRSTRRSSAKAKPGNC